MKNVVIKYIIFQDTTNDDNVHEKHFQNKSEENNDAKYNRSDKGNKSYNLYMYLNIFLVKCVIVIFYDFKVT